MAAETGQLVFGPAIAAIDRVAGGDLVEIDVVGWEVSADLVASYSVDRVKAPLERAATAALRQRLATLTDACVRAPRARTAT